MTIERACYHKLMLEVGLTERFDQELDELLEEENPLRELTLALSTCGGDRNEQIHILNEFICSVPKEQIDSDAVFSLVIKDFRARYENNPDNLKEITIQMGSVAWHSGWWTDDPWNAMYLMSDWYGDIEYRLLSRKAFLESFLKLIYHGEAFDPVDAQRQKLYQNTLAARIRFFFHKKRAEKAQRKVGELLTGVGPNTLFLPCRARRGTAYFEFQYCKTEGSVKAILNSHQFWLPDSLVVHIDDQERLMDDYLPFLEHPESPDGSSTFCYYGVNYYTKDRASQMLEQIKAAKPEDCDTLIPWLEKAATKYNGFYFLGI